MPWRYYHSMQLWFKSTEASADFTPSAEVIIESKASNNDDVLHAMEFPDGGLAYSDVDKLDPSTVYHNEEDKRYLESLTELPCEAIFAKGLGKLKKVTEIKKVLSHAAKS
jgi:hypothetical protein